MSALIVVLPAQPITASTEFDYAVTGDGSTVANHGTAQAALLPLPARAGSEVVALVPVSKLSWHRVELPKGVTPRSPRLRAVIEGLLEDQLLDEPETLHFALQPDAVAEAALWVATCEREWLRAALQTLEAAGRPVTRIAPEFAPEGELTLYALGEDAETATLVAAGESGVTALPLTPAAMSLLPSSEGASCVAEPGAAAAAEQLLQLRPVLQHPSERWVQAAQTPWDLAQFEFSSSGRARALKKLGTAWGDLLSARQWRPARWGAVLLVAIHLVGLNAWAWRERAQLEEKRQAIGRTLTQTFPNVKIVVDAPVQMEREIAALRQTTGATSARDLEPMLAALGATLPPGSSVTAVDYANGELRVRGLPLAGENAQRVTTALKGQGYAAAVRGDTLVVTPEVQP